LKNHLVPFLIALALLTGCGTSPPAPDELKSDIQGQFDQTEGSFALAFINLSDTSQSLMINADSMFHAASTMKTPVMIEIFKQAGQGKFSLSDSVEVKNEFRSIVDSSSYSMDIGEDSDDGLYEMIGKQRTVLDLVNDMITASSNLATNILVQKVGATNVTQTMRSYGADSIRVLRGVEDIKAFDRGMNNETNARDLAVIFEKMGRGGAVNPQASEQMIDILKQQEFNEMIPAKLPDSVQVAHKTGWITGVHHDSGLIILPDGRQYVLVLLSKEAPDREAVMDMFAGISRDLYDYVILK
jgi:beta-lactamase class A